jgi:hypothetical protein
MACFETKAPLNYNTKTTTLFVATGHILYAAISFAESSWASQFPICMYSQTDLIWAAVWLVVGGKAFWKERNPLEVRQLFNTYF